MALISDPLIFLVPTFRFERDGTFTFNAGYRGPNPENIFSCKVVKDITIPSLPRRENAEKFPIGCGERAIPIIFLASVEKHTPLFWRAELFNQQGRMCDESVYADLWQLKRGDELAFFSFDEKTRPLELRAEGRLMEVMLYAALFEEDERAGERIFHRLQEQAIQKVVAENWQELMSTIRVDLSTGNSSLLAQLGQIYGSVAEAAKLLVPKGIFGRLFR